MATTVFILLLPIWVLLFKIDHKLGKILSNQKPTKDAKDTSDKP